MFTDQRLFGVISNLSKECLPRPTVNEIKAEMIGPKAKSDCLKCSVDGVTKG